MEYHVGDWVQFLDDDGNDLIEEVIRVDGNAVYTKSTGKYWLTDSDIFAVRDKP